MERRQTVNLDEEEVITSDNKLTLSHVEIKRRFMVDIAIYSDQKFVGDIVPIPNILIRYLNATELRVFSIILQQLKSHECAIIRRKAIADELGVTAATVSNTVNALDSMGIISQQMVGRRKTKTINFNTIQMLEEKLKNRKPGAIRAYRKAMGEGDIRMSHPTADAILELQYTELPEEEQEEYI